MAASSDAPTREELNQLDEAYLEAQREWSRLRDEVERLKHIDGKKGEVARATVQRNIAEAKWQKAFFLYHQRNNEKEKADLLMRGQGHLVPDVDESIKYRKDQVKEWEDKFQQWKQQLLELEQEEEYQRLLDEALKVGYIECELFVAILVGPAGVGKTCLLHLLLGKKPPLFRSSTGVAESPVTIQIRAVSGSKIEVFLGGKWEEITSENMLPKLAHYISRGFATSDAGGQGNPLPKDVEECLEQLSRSSPSGDQGDTSATPEGSAATPTVNPPLQHGSTSAAIEKVIESVMGELRKLMSSEDLGKDGGKEIFSAAWVYFTDCGGQPQFHELLPLFVHGISAAVFVCRLSDRLDGYPADEYYKDGKLVGSALSTQLTTEDQIKCLIRSLLSRSTKLALPKIIIVGTHLDKIKECSESLDEKNRKLLEMLGPEFREQLVFFERNRLIFPVNTRSPGKHEEDVASSVREAIEKSAARKVKIPIWWYLLEILLRNLAAKLGTKVLPRSVCLEIARRLNFTEKAFNAALKFFNDLNIIKYSDALPDIIFIDSQVPLDKVSELVQRCYYLLYGKGPFRSYDDKWRRFCEEGVITVDLLREFESHYVDGLFECQHLIQLLRHQLAVVPLAEIEPAASIDEQCDAVDFFFPAFLKMLQRPDLEKHRVFSCAATPLLFRFSHGCRRSGVFCCLVVHLMKHCNWCIQHENGDLILVARNCITFRPYRNDCYVTLIDAFFYIEVHVEAPPPKCIEHCPTIRKEITDGIVAACKVLKYANDHPQLAFFCPHSGSVEVKRKEDRHAATILDKGGYCSCTQTKHFFELEKKHNIWLKGQDVSVCEEAATATETVEHNVIRTETASASTQGTNVQQATPSTSTLPSKSTDKPFAQRKPALHQLDMLKGSRKTIRVIDRIAHVWDRVATRLYFEGHEIKRIKRDCPQTLEASREIIMEWLEGNESLRKPVTWAILIEALDEAELSEVTKDIVSILNEYDSL